MVKVLDRDRDDSIDNNGVAVQISGNAGGQHTRIAIALQKDAPPSNYIPMEPHVRSFVRGLSPHFACTVSVEPASTHRRAADFSGPRGQTIKALRECSR